MVIFGDGRNAQEKSVVWIENGSYCGFGYIDETSQFTQLYDVKDVITKYPDNRDVQFIINSYLSKHPHTQIEKF